MKRILVVDDQPDNVFILQDRLEHEGFEVIKAYDGPSGISLATEQCPDLILLDVMMPGMSGFEVCKTLSLNESTKDIPIILVTALGEASDLSEGLQAGAFDYIKKPFNKIELIARINSALRFAESNKMLIELARATTFSATVITANHEIKQPLTLINLSTTAIKREIGKEEINKEAVLKRVQFIESASHNIIDILNRLNQIKTPVFTEYINDLKMIDIKSPQEAQSSS